MSPPDTVQGDDSYRKSPFTIQAVKSGDYELFDFVLQLGG